MNAMPCSFWLPRSEADILLERPTLYNLKEVLLQWTDPSPKNRNVLDAFLFDLKTEIIEMKQDDDIKYEIKECVKKDADGKDEEEKDDMEDIDKKNEVLFVSAKLVWFSLIKLLDEDDIAFKDEWTKNQVINGEKMKEDEGWTRFLIYHNHKTQDRYLTQLSHSQEFKHNLKMYELREEAARLENEKKRLEIELLQKRLGKSNKRSRDESSDEF